MISLDLRVLRRCLTALLAAVSAAVVMDQAHSFVRPQIGHETVGPPPEDRFSPKEIDLEPLQAFQEAIAKGNLFNVTDADSGAIVHKSSMAELVKDYRLKGIALFNAPEGIIEDATTGRSVFVKEGEKLGQVTVKQIKGESVVLSHAGEESELKIQGAEVE